MPGPVGTLASPGMGPDAGAVCGSLPLHALSDYIAAGGSGTGGAGSAGGRQGRGRTAGEEDAAG